MFSQEARFAAAIAHGAGNLDELAHPNLGAGIVVGLDEEGATILLYFITGNEPCRVQAKPRARVHVASMRHDAPLRCRYDCFTEAGGLHCIGNGPHTEAVHQLASSGRTSDFLPKNGPFPDGTPRMTALFDERTAQVEFVISGQTCGPTPLTRGVGYCVTAFGPYEGEPFSVALRGCDFSAITGTFWNALNRRTRIALAAKRVPPEGKGPRTLRICQ